MASLDVHYSSNKEDWATPKDFFDRLDKEFCFTLDPCASEKNAKCAKFFTKDQDGLAQSWEGETVFMNPPYGRKATGQWIKKASEANTTVVCLVPSRTDTTWWHDYVMKAAEVRFVRGRIKFEGAQSGAPFPSAVIVFTPGVNGVTKFGQMESK